MELVEMQRNGHVVKVEPRQVPEFEAAGFAGVGAVETKRKPSKRSKAPATMDDPGDDPVEFPATMDN